MQTKSTAKAAYPFEQVSGTSVLDFAGGTTRHNGTLTGNATVTTPAAAGIATRPGGDSDGHILSLDGASDFMQVAASSDLEPGAGAFSFACWIYLEDATQEQAIASTEVPSGAGWVWRVFDAGRLQLLLRNSTATSTVGVDTAVVVHSKEWVHLAFTWTGNNNKDGLTIYVGGVVTLPNEILSNDMLTNVSSGAALKIASGISSLPFTGFVDQVGIWQEALTADQIAALAKGAGFGTLNSRNSTAANTEIATSKPLDICKGFAYFGNDARAAGAGASFDPTIFDLTVKVFLFEFFAEAKANLFAGACIGYAIGFDVEEVSWFPNDSDNTQSVSIEVTNDEMVGGLAFGVEAGVSVKAGVKLGESQWSSKIVGNSAAISFNFSINVDIIQVIVIVINELLMKLFGEAIPIRRQARFTISNTTRLLTGTWGWTDSKANQFAKNNGKFEITPEFNIPIDVVPFIDGLDEIALALQKVRGSIAYGIYIGVAIPLTVTIDKITLDGEKYDSGSSDVTPIDEFHAQVVGQGSTNVSTIPTKVGAELSSVPAFGLSAGIFASFKIFHLIHVGARLGFDILSLAGIKIEFGPFVNSLSSTIGEGPGEAEAGQGATEELEVILEPAG